MMTRYILALVFAVSVSGSSLTELSKELTMSYQRSHVWQSIISHTSLIGFDPRPLDGGNPLQSGIEFLRNQQIQFPQSSEVDLVKSFLMKYDSNIRGISPLFIGTFLSALAVAEGQIQTQLLTQIDQQVGGDESDLADSFSSFSLKGEHY